MRGFGTWVVGVALTVWLAFSVPSDAQTSPAAVNGAHITARIDAFQNIIWQPEDNYFLSPGAVRITLSGLDDGEEIILNADDAEGRPSGEILVRGNVSVRRRDAILTGTSLRFDAVRRTGSMKRAEARVSVLTLTGSEINMAEYGALEAQQARLTTCSCQQPHYFLSAQELRLTPTRKVTARQVRLVVAGRTLLVIPYMEKTFTDRVESPFPLPNYSKETGPKFRLASEVLSSPRSSLRYDGSISLRRPPFGNVAFERALGKPNAEVPPPTLRKSVLDAPFAEALETFPMAGSSPVDYSKHRRVLFAVAGTNEYIYHRVRTDLRVSRLPELGLVAYQSGRSSGASAGSAAWTTYDRFSYFGELTGGYYQENTTDTKSARTQLRLGAASPNVLLARNLSFRLGMDARGALYGSGETYTVVAPQAELVWRVRPEMALSVAGIHRTYSGRTPFVFDRLDTRNEVRLRYDGDYPRWGLGLQVAYDADRWRAYDTSFSVVHKLDCMEFGLSYRTRSQGLGVVLNLLPGKAASENLSETLKVAEQPASRPEPGNVSH